MKFLLSLLFITQVMVPAYGATTRTISGDQIKTPDMTKTFTFPPATTQLVGTSTVQILSNKDIDGGTATNTSRITLPKAATAALTALTRKQGTLVYDTTLNKPYYDDGTALVAVGSGSGTGTSVFAPPTVRSFLSGSGTYNKNYTFVVSPGSATTGAVYTNNGVAYTVYSTVASGVQIVLSGTSTPATTGTLTKTSGTGDATLTFSQYLAPLYLHVKMVAGGGGGSGSGSATSGGTGGTGGTTSFGTSLLSCTGGVGGVVGLFGFTDGGTFTVNSPAINTGSMGGSRGQGADNGNQFSPGGQPGVSPFGGGGGGGSGGSGSVATYVGGSATANSGSGGGGAGASTSMTAGSGGGSGGYVDAIIPSPALTYSYAVGAAGTLGAAGTSGTTGGAGGSGAIYVTEHYQ